MKCRKLKRERIEKLEKVQLPVTLPSRPFSYVVETKGKKMQSSSRELNFTILIEQYLISREMFVARNNFRRVDFFICNFMPVASVIYTAKYPLSHLALRMNRFRG